MPKPKDELWEFFKRVDGKEQKIECIFCAKIISGGITRGRYHLSKLCARDVEPCMKVPLWVYKKASHGAQRLEERKNKRQKVTGPSDRTHITQPDVKIEPTDHMEQETKNMEACKAFTRWALSHNVPLNSLKSPHFLKACSLVAKNGHEYEPLCDDFKQKKVVSELNRDAILSVESVRQSARTSGCTLVMDVWAFGVMHYFMLMAVSLKNTMLLKSECWPGLPNNKTMEELTSGFIRVMGPQNVVQVLAPDGYFLSGFDAGVYNQTGVFVTRICKSMYTNVISSIYATKFCNNVYETCKKIVEFLYSNAEYRCLMKMYTNGQEIRQCHGSNFERQFVTLKLVLNAENALRLMFASVEMSVQDPNVTEVKKIVEGSKFWEQGKKNIMAMESLLKTLKLIDGHTSNMGYIYHAFLRAREATEVLMEEKGGYSLGLQDACSEMSKEMDHSLYKIGAYLNPHLFFDKEVRLNDGDIDALEDDIRLMVPTCTKNEIVRELKCYRAQEMKIYGEAAINSLRTHHPRLWWEKWGGKVPILQSLAIKILSQPCYFKGSAGELRRIIQSAHAEKQNRNPVEQEWEELLLLKVHSHLEETKARNEEADSKPIFWDEIEDFLDSSYIEGFDAVEASVYDGGDSKRLSGSTATEDHLVSLHMEDSDAIRNFVHNGDAGPSVDSSSMKGFDTVGTSVSGSSVEGFDAVGTSVSVGGAPSVFKETEDFLKSTAVENSAYDGNYDDFWIELDRS